MSWFDNMGMATAFTGNFDAEGTLVLNSEYPRQGTEPFSHQEAARRETRVPERDAGPGRRLDDCHGIDRDGDREGTAFRG
jgi:hypothetical protein